MKLHIQSIHFDADVKLLDFVQKKLDKLDTFYDRIVEGEVLLKLQNVDKNNKLVQVKLSIPGNDLLAKEEGASFEEATDKVYDSLKRQLTKHKEKMATY
ncbi:MAG: ribosome-associated translation inhibitor RaiA [Cytophagales bacterium]|nr:MAG: ribosome-associated translation inhibitor RaiA [Cytophagales bacterium]